jgi:hypothetical protein
MLMPAAAASIPAVKSAQCPPGHIVRRAEAPADSKALHDEGGVTW